MKRVQENSRGEKKEKKNLIQRVERRKNCANRMQKRENPNCKTGEGDTCVAPENEKRATLFLVEQIGKSNAGIPINSTEFHPVSPLFARISLECRGCSKNRF